MSYPAGYIEQLARPLRSGRRPLEVPLPRDERRQEAERRLLARDAERAELAAERLQAVRRLPPRR